MPESETEVSVEQRGPDAERGEVGGGARGAPADDVTGQPALEPRRAFEGVESPGHHGCLPG